MMRRFLKTLSDSRFFSAEELPRLNVLWVGPPPPQVGLIEQTLGNDTKSVVDLARRCANPIAFYCLEEHVGHYRNLFASQEVAIRVVSIDAYIDTCITDTSENADVNMLLRRLAKIKEDQRSSPRIVHRISFKDVFSLLILAREGGYTLDANVSLNPGIEDYRFMPVKKFTCPRTQNLKNDCWMMALPSLPKNNRALWNFDLLNMLGIYLDGWDRIQREFQNKPQTVYNVVTYHDRLERNMMGAVNYYADQVNSQHDPNWGFTINLENNTGTLHGIPATKTYANSHKPWIVLGQKFSREIANYTPDCALDNPARQTFLAYFRSCIPNDYVLKLTDLFVLERFFNGLKEIDDMLQQASIHASEKVMTQICLASEYTYSKLNNLVTESRLIGMFFPSEFGVALGYTSHKSLNRELEASAPIQGLTEIINTCRKELTALMEEKQEVNHSPANPPSPIPQQQIEEKNDSVSLRQDEGRQSNLPRRTS